MSRNEKKFAKLPLLAAFVALIGLGDAVYLTVKHYTAAPVPCNILEGCEMVLTSAYATLPGILTAVFGMDASGVPAVPLSLFGALAYLTAFVLAVLSAFGNRLTWTLFTVQAVFMALFSVWLIYLQAFVIGAFCQFCLLSAGISFTLFIIALISFFRRSKFA
jgi:Predicted membrane protein